MNSTDDLGPLPHADGGDELQRVSLKALRAALPDSEWIVRDERTDDLGVDASLEVLVHGLGTNFRSQLQVKGRSDLSPNSDGSWSVGVKVANLNYLLSGPTPFYILFRPETEELFFASARDELHRIERNNPNWKDQKEVTLRFADRLDSKVLAKIRSRIIEEARASRRLRDIAISLAPGSKVQVDAVTLRPSSPIEAEKQLLATGMEAVTQGFGNRVLEVLSAVDPRRVAADPKLLLIRGYAEFFAGRYLRADAPLRDALVLAGKLSEDDRHFVRFLIEAVDHAQGRTTSAVFRGRAAEWRASASDVLAAQYDVLDSWMARCEATTPEEQLRHDRVLRSAIERLVAIPGAPPALLHYAESLRLFLDAQEVGMRLVDVLGASADPVVWNLRYREPAPVVIGRCFAEVEAWRARADRLMTAVASAGNIPRYCEIRHTRHLCEEMFLGHLRDAALMMDRPLPKVSDALLADVRATRAFAATHDQVEFELREGLVESGLEDLRGNEAAARRIAEDVAIRAAALRFGDIERVTRRTLSEGGRHSVRAREIHAAKADGFDSVLMKMSPEEQIARAREPCELLGLPAERLPVLLDGLRCETAVATERRDWCRHLRVLEQPPPELSPDFVYSRPPERCCTCELLGHRSLVTTSAWAQLIPAFKSAHCSECASRQPRRASS